MRLASAAAAAGAGVLLAACFVLPAPGAWALAALALLAAIASRDESGWRAFGLGWLFGLGWFCAGLSWLYVSIHGYGGVPAAAAAALVVLFAAGLAVFPALALSIARLAAARRWVFLLVSFPASWGISEWLRGTVLTGFPWIHVGLTQLDTPLGAYAPVAGAYGTSALAALAAGCLAALAVEGKNRHWGLCTVSAAVLAVQFAGGLLLERVSWSQPHEQIAVRLVQTDMPQMAKFGPDGVRSALERNVRQLAAPWPQAAGIARLVVLPETVFPALWDDLPVAVRETLLERPRQEGAWMILGAFGRSDRGYTNEALCVAPRGTATSYRKRHLVPFGEFVPPGFRWLIDAMKIPMPDQVPGSAWQQLPAVAGSRVGISLCYEDLFLEESRDYWSLGQSPGLIVNLSNLAWFGRSWALPQHLLASRLLAKATARPVVRATNTGVTAIIDADGRVTARAPVCQETVLDALVQARRGPATPFVRFGNLPWVLAMLLVLSACFMGRRRTSIWED